MGRHHGEMGEHVVGSEEAAEGLHDVGDATATLNDFLVHGGGELVPFPSVFEGFELGGGAGAILFGEEDVVVLIAFERRVEVDEVDGFVFDVAKDFEIVAVIKLVHRMRPIVPRRARADEKNRPLQKRGASERII